MLRRIADDVVAKRRANNDIIDDDALVRVQAEDRMDCGAAIKLTMDIDRRRGTATLDFAGSSEQVFTNINAPKAVTFSAVIYRLRREFVSLLFVFRSLFPSFFFFFLVLASKFAMFGSRRYSAQQRLSDANHDSHSSLFDSVAE